MVLGVSSPNLYEVVAWTDSLVEAVEAAAVTETVGKYGP